MNILISTLKEELATAKRLEKKYLKQLGDLPHGSFILRTVRKKKYGYLTFREGGKVKQTYLGSLDEQQVEEYCISMKKKRELKEKLKNVRSQQRILERGLRGKTE